MTSAEVFLEVHGPKVKTLTVSELADVDSQSRPVLDLCPNVTNMVLLLNGVPVRIAQLFASASVMY